MSFVFSLCAPNSFRRHCVCLRDFVGVGLRCFSHACVFFGCVCVWRADWLLTVIVAVILLVKRSEVDNAPSAEVGAAAPPPFPTAEPVYGGAAPPVYTGSSQPVYAASEIAHDASADKYSVDQPSVY